LGASAGNEGLCAKKTVSSSFVQLGSFNRINAKNVVMEEEEELNMEEEEEELDSGSVTIPASFGDEEPSLLQTETKASFEAWKNAFHARMRSELDAGDNHKMLSAGYEPWCKIPPVGLGSDCWRRCRKAGYCSACDDEGSKLEAACCSRGSWGADPEECKRGNFLGGHGHRCVSLRPVGAPPPPCTEGCVRHLVTCMDWWMKHRSKTADEASSVCRSEMDTDYHKMQGAGCVPFCKIPDPTPRPTPEPGKPVPCTKGCVRHFVTCKEWWMKHRSKTADEAYSVCRSERDTKHHKMQGAGCVPLCKIPGPKPSPTPEPGKQVLYTFKKASGNPDCGKGNSNMLHDYGHGVSLEDCKRNCQDHCIDITWAPGNHHCKTFASCLNAGPNRGWEHYQKGEDTTKECPSGYVLSPGDIPGWGSIRGGLTAASSTECGAMCNAEEDCRSFEYSSTAKRCNLNREKTPTMPQYKDYSFCSQVV